MRVAHNGSQMSARVHEPQTLRDRDRLCSKSARFASDSRVPMPASLTNSRGKSSGPAGMNRNFLVQDIKNPNVSTNYKYYKFSAKSAISVIPCGSQVKSHIMPGMA